MLAEAGRGPQLVRVTRDNGWVVAKDMGEHEDHTGGRGGDAGLIRYLVMALEDEVHEFIWQARALRAAGRASADALAMERRVGRRILDVAFALRRRAALGTPSGAGSRTRRLATGDTAQICPRYGSGRAASTDAGSALPSPDAPARVHVRDPHDPPDDASGYGRRLSLELRRVEEDLPEFTWHIEERWRERRKAGQRFFELQLRLRQRIREVLFTLRRLYEPNINLYELHFRLGGDGDDR